MRYSSKQIFRDRKGIFSGAWFEIVETRLVLCVVIALFSSLTSDSVKLKNILASTAAYLSFNLLLGFWSASTLRLKRIRAIPALVDLVFISFLIHFTGGQHSPWFLLYFFPIISVSRYLSYEGSLPLMALAVAAYLVVARASSPEVDYYLLTLRCLVFLGIALVAGNLTREGQRREDNLLEIFNEIDSAILNNSAANKVLRLILQKALEFTRSDLGQMRILSSDVNSTYTITVNSEPKEHQWNLGQLTDRYCEKAIRSKKAFSIPAIRGGGDSPNSALCVPLILKGEVKAVIALYSQNRLHYSPTEAIKLQSFAQLLGIAIKNYDMYQAIANSENEKKARLKVLYEIGEQLKVEQGLADIFRKVVEVMYNQLNSEEAALFIVDEKDKNLIRKVAVRGPSDEITERLLKIEPPYTSGQSLIGKIFRDQKYEHFNEMPPDVEYQDEYSSTLPSQGVCHYLGVPLILGKEVVGVIRVINKRAVTYATENNNFKLSEQGFDEEDVELLQTIASQVASAIRSAKFVEVQRYYQELLENSPDPIIVLDERGRVKVFNKACEKIWGLRADEVKNEKVANYYESESHAKSIGRLLMESPNHRLHDHPARIRASSGEIIPISLSAALLFDNQNNKIGSIGVFKDFRETLRLQAENLNAEKLVTLGKLAHTIGHEIKHNIATGLNYIDTLAYECSDDEELSEIYRDVQETLKQAVDKFQNMLMIGKPKPPQKELISYQDVIRRVKDPLRRRASARNIEFSVQSPSEPLQLEADIEQLRQVITNLFDNSLDAIGAKLLVSEKGRIELLTQVSNGDLQLTWQDNGCGISTDRMPQMFSPFSTTKPTGNGLGLFIIRNIIENHGGTISLESEEGRGTKFRIVLPLSRKLLEEEIFHKERPHP